MSNIIRSEIRTKIPKLSKEALKISSIQVKNLFGQYNYVLEFSKDKFDVVSKLKILYGDNGTGKTTILHLLFHLLSPKKEEGHRSALAQIPLSKFSVTLSNGTTIFMQRKGTQLIGNYYIGIVRRGRKQLRGKIEIDNDGSAIIPWQRETERILDMLPKLGLSVFFLTDDRIFQSDEIRELHPEREARKLGSKYRDRSKFEENEDPRNLALLQVLVRIDRWGKQLLIKATSQGEADAYSIYRKIVEKISKGGRSVKKRKKIDRVKISRALEELDARTRLFAPFKLASPFNSKIFIKLLNDAAESDLPAILQVTSSLLESQEARLDALQNLYERLNRFVELTNEFLLHKSIGFNIRDGLYVQSEYSKELEFDHLSSGEKQLLLLLCNVLISTESTALFIIDEPELSLNVKWQRKLIDVLLQMTSDSECQFILATHSIDILAKHKENVLKLDPKVRSI